MSNIFRRCDKCGKIFREDELEYSHDIPKYLGGNDKDGRHLLCKKCHDRYENMLLLNSYRFLFKKDPNFDFYSENRLDRIELMRKIKLNRNRPELKRYIKKIAKRWFL